jgi:hypothetical protein
MQPHPAIRVRGREVEKDNSSQRPKQVARSANHLDPTADFFDFLFDPGYPKHHFDPEFGLVGMGLGSW